MSFELHIPLPLVAERDVCLFMSHKIVISPLTVGIYEPYLAHTILPQTDSFRFHFFRKYERLFLDLSYKT